MPRKRTTKPAEDLTETADTKAIEAATAAADARSADLVVIDQQYGDGLPFDAQRLITETRFYLNQSAEAMLEAGTRCVLLKEHLPHGEFTEALEQIGIESRAARKMMQAAVKFSKRPTLAGLGRSKLLELMATDDDDLDALDDGGTLAGHTLDVIEKMSVRELKAALRKEKKKREQEKEVSDRLIQNKDDKINELDAELSRREVEPPSWSDTTRALSAELEVTAGNALEALDTLRAIREQILQIPTDESDSAVELIAVNFMQNVQLIFGHIGSEVDASSAVFEGYVQAAHERAANAGQPE